MSTSDRRIYGSAQELIDIYRLRPDRIAGSGKDGALTKGDVRAYLAGEQDEAPPQHAQTLYLAVQGFDSEAIAERVRACHEGSNMKPAHVSWSISKERRRDSAWWNDPGVQAALRKHRPGLKGVEPDESGEVKRAASSGGASGGGS